MDCRRWSFELCEIAALNFAAGLDGRRDASDVPVPRPPARPSARATRQILPIRNPGAAQDASPFPAETVSGGYGVCVLLLGFHLVCSTAISFPIPINAHCTWDPFSQLLLYSIMPAPSLLQISRHPFHWKRRGEPGIVRRASPPARHGVKGHLLFFGVRSAASCSVAAAAEVEECLVLKEH